MTSISPKFSVKLSTSDWHKILVAWNDTKTDYPKDKCIHRLFEIQVEQTPDNIAVVFDNNKLSYRELNTQANQLAHYLRTLGVKPATLVGICLERSLNMIVGLLAILKAGGVYVPLDPDYPKERLTIMLADSQVAVLLTQEKLVTRLTTLPIPIVKLDTDWETIAQQNQENPINNSKPEDLAYVIYTSGSTGKPKGVAIPHQAINRLVNNTNYIDISATDVMAQVSNCSFDAATFEIWGALLHGAKLVILTKNIVLSPQDFVTQLREQGISLLFLTTALFNQLAQTVPSAFASLRCLLFGGEAVNPIWVSKVLNQASPQQLLHVYGPTETTTFATWYLVKEVPENATTVPIGRPISNTQCYILDDQLQPLPIGSAGELYIGGDGLAQGYLNQLDLTHDRFITVSFGDLGDSRVYKTGDLVRYLPDGNIEFLGRLDNQVKLRGFRIELGEIETVLARHPNVQQAVVIVDEIQPGDKRLVAYITANQPPTPSELYHFLQAQLPDYMIPAAFILLEKLPLTPNGKIDRQALPTPDFSQSDHSENEVAPRSATEISLATIWSQVIKREFISIQSNFFELGGHSLLATQVISRIRETFQVNLPLAYLFDNPTIANLAKQIDTLLQSSSLEMPAVQASEGTASTYTLSISQQSFWLFEQLHPQTPTYHIPFAFKLSGTLDLSALERAVSEMVRRHTILRTTFELDDNNFPTQRIAPPRPVTVIVKERQPSAADEIKQWLAEEINQPFDLTKEHLLRVTLWLIGKQEQILLCLFHHLITDGWSVGLFIKELSELYAIGLKNQIIPKDSSYQYVDFCRWQTQWLASPLADTQLTYWQTQLAAPLPVLELPTDYSRPPIQTYCGARQVIVIAPPLTLALRQLSHQQGVTLFMTLLAAFKTLLYRYTGQTDLLVGTAIANRQRLEWEQVLGLFINTLILRTQPAGSTAFTTFLHQVRDVALAAYQHQDLSFQILVDKIHPDRDLSHNPLFQTFFLLQNFDFPNLELAGLTTTPIAINTGTSKFDLTLELYEKAEHLEGWFEYNVDLFNTSTIQRLEGHLQTLLTDIVAYPEKSLSRLQILTEAERNQWVHPPKLIRPINPFIEFTQAEIEQSIPARFAQQVKKYPQHIAVKTPHTQFTYTQLHAQANQVAQALLAVVNEEQPNVGLLFEHDASMIVAIMGVLTAGLTYVPLTPDLPFQRLVYILQDSQAQILLTHNPHLTLAQNLISATRKLINIDDLKANSGAKLPTVISPDSLAYLLYTSGTTGQPKGVIQNHRNVLHFIRNYTNNLHINANDQLSLLSSYSFDAAVMDIFAALLNGATLCPINLKEDYQAYSLKNLIQKQGITIYHSTPTVYRHFISTLTANDRFPKLRLIVMGGEEVYQADFAAYQQYFSNHCLFINGLGPSESTVTLQYFLNKQSSNPQPTVPVGYPVEKTEITLLNEKGEETELYGEMAIKSDYIALGYWQQPSLTQAAFQFDQNQRRYYRTGDLGRLRGDGSIEFNGRKDSQVKLRGYRIELSEIEAILQQHPAVQESTAMIREDQPGLKQLVAYIVPPPQELVIPTGHEFRQFLKEKLPDYMVPSAIMILNAIPLLHNGKVNYRQLPVPVPESTTFVAPRSDLEQQLTSIWEKILGISSIGVHDNFFNLGGHSLLAVALINQIEKQFSKRLPLISLFQAPTIAQQAWLLQEQQSSRSWTILEAIQPLGTRPILFFLCPGHYVRNLSQVLGLDQPIYRLEILGLQSSHRQIFSLDIATKRFIQEIQSIQPQGPYYLLGFCGLAKMAIELARQLQEQGHSIAFLGLIQAIPYYPRWSFSQHWSNLLKSGPIYLWQKIIKKFRANRNRLTYLFLSKMNTITPPQPVKENLSPQLEYTRFVNSFIHTLNNYAMPPYRGDMVLFHLSEWCTKNATQLELAQQVAAGKIEIYEIPAKIHDRLCITPQVEVLGKQLQLYLEQHCFNVSSTKIE
jgi:amino acid adenylation domain-containing protein